MGKKEIIETLGSEESKLIVQKSLPLLALWRSDLTLSEFKILDVYLSRINSRQPEKRTVVFGKGELENIIGVKKINNSQLKDRLKHLMSSVVELPDKDYKEGFRLVTLFEEAEAKQDDYGRWQVKLECTEKAMKYFFNIENLGYLRYKLRCITCISSRYTYIMFIYLESNRFRKSWEVKLDELKEILNCENDEAYRQYKYFNNLILRKVQKELNEKTECKYTYEPVKKGRLVAAIRFTLKTLSDIELSDSETAYKMPLEIDDSGSDKEVWESALDSYGLSHEQTEEVRSLLVTLPESKLPADPTGCGDLQFRWYHYLDRKRTQIDRIDREKPVKNKYRYLITVIKKDCENT